MANFAIVLRSSARKKAWSSRVEQSEFAKNASDAHAETTTHRSFLWKGGVPKLRKARRFGQMRGIGFILMNGKTQKVVISKRLGRCVVRLLPVLNWLWGLRA
ncbi:MAG: hypothetical protein QM784_04795 [Polyangiaceae bacterium]